MTTAANLFFDFVGSHWLHIFCILAPIAVGIAYIDQCRATGQKWWF